jgi:O-antigen/teichoic acid export membrane protein
VATTLFVIVWSWFSRDHWGMVAGMVFGQVLTTLLSHLLAQQAWPRWTLERATLRELFGFAKYVMPSSLLTMLLAQFDKLVLVRLFDLRTMGVYGVASSLSGPAENLAVQVGDALLYPRCAQAHRDDPSQLRQRFYRDNAKLLALMAAVPALIGGSGQFIVDLLFDPRYREAGFVVQWLMLRGVLLAVLRPSEAVQTAAGHPSVQLLSNSLRLTWLVPASLLGYSTFGFAGFVAGVALEPAAALVATLWQQARRGLLEPRHEVLRAVGIALLWALSWSASSALALLLGEI